MNYQNILFNIEKKVAVIKFNRPKALNAINPDVLAEVKGDFLRVGFAAETEDHVENARQKLANKQLDLIASNDVTAPDSGFGVDTNRVTLIDRDGKAEELPLMLKREVADKLLDKVVELLR